MKRETIAIHAGYEPDAAMRSVAVPIYQTVAYAFDSAEHAAALFNLEAEGYRYTRISNPTTAVLERRMAALEGGLEAMCVATGQAAVNYAVLNLVGMGGNVVSPPQLYGTTHTLFAHILPGQGVSVRFAGSDRPEAMERLIDAETRAIYCESVGNPAGNICDIQALAQVAHRHGIPLVVDNTVATPMLLRPIEYGADIVVHSLTKFMGGHGTTLGGVIVDSGRFPWAQHAARFPMFCEPDHSYHGLVYTERYGPAAYIARCRSRYLRATGAVLAPLSAFLLLQGVETAALRVERHVENGRKVAEFLRSDPRVTWVNYAGFPDSPYYALAQKYLDGQGCSLMTLGVKGDYEAAVRFYDALKLITRLVNLGDAKSLACHPASTTHRQMSPEEQRNAGVLPEMIRLSIGIEHIDDILADLDQALDAAMQARTLIAAARKKEFAMPVLLNLKYPDPERQSGLDWPRVLPGALEEPRRTLLRIGLVNNMADAAMCATEHQFLKLLEAAAGDMLVHVTLYALPEVERTSSGQRRVNSLYFNIEQLWEQPAEQCPDGLIVTGREPRTPDLRDEAYWPSLKRILAWTQEHARSAVWSCLAAHAAVLALDGIERVRGQHKYFGIFTCEQATPHALLGGAPAHPRFPHSRWNGVSAGQLAANGYQVLTRTDDGGVDTFVKQDAGLFVFFQGHPEYESETLMGEYRRDAGRYLRGEMETYPSLPLDYFDEETERSLREIEAKARASRQENLLGEVSAVLGSVRIRNTWRSTAALIYRNWLKHLRIQQRQRRKPMLGVAV